MNSIKVLEYFKKIKENYENIKTIEGFEIEYCWGETSNIPPPSWTHEDGRVYDPKYKYNSLYYQSSNITSNQLPVVAANEETSTNTKIISPTTTVNSLSDVEKKSSHPETKPDAKEKSIKKSDNCSNNIFDFECNKEMKILIWCLIVFTILFIFVFVGYALYKYFDKSNSQLPPIVNIPQQTLQNDYVIANQTPDNQYMSRQYMTDHTNKNNV